MYARGHLADQRRKSPSTARPTIDRDMFESRYADVYKGDEHWQAINVDRLATPTSGAPVSTYVANPPYFEGMDMTPAPITDIVDAKPLAILGDSVTTDHISPGRLDQGRQPGGRVPDRATRSRSRTSTPTARAAATTK